MPEGMTSPRESPKPGMGKNRKKAGKKAAGR
jgi:hypothetical protein